MIRVAEASAEKKRKEKEYDDAERAAKLEEIRVADEGKQKQNSDLQIEPYSRGIRVRKLPWKLRD